MAVILRKYNYHTAEPLVPVEIAIAKFKKV
jgi:hypothetical protein